MGVIIEDDTMSQLNDSLKIYRPAGIPEKDELTSHPPIE